MEFSTTTASSVAVQAGDSKIVIAVLKVSSFLCSASPWTFCNVLATYPLSRTQHVKDSIVGTCLLNQQLRENSTEVQPASRVSVSFQVMQKSSAAVCLQRKERMQSPSVHFSLVLRGKVFCVLRFLTVG